MCVLIRPTETVISNTRVGLNKEKFNVPGFKFQVIALKGRDIIAQGSAL